MVDKNKFLLGLTLDEPSLFIPWSITETELPELLKGCEYEKIANRYYGMTVTLFDKCFHGFIGFHFSWKGKLTTLELNNADCDHSDDDAILRSFENTQKTLEAYFGKPSKLHSVIHYLISNHRIDNKVCVWNFKKAKIIHTAYDRFGLEERLEIVIK